MQVYQQKALSYHANKETIYNLSITQTFEQPNPGHWETF